MTLSQKATALYIAMLTALSNNQPDVATTTATELKTLCDEAKAACDKVVSDYWHKHGGSLDALDVHIVSISREIDPLLFGTLNRIRFNERGNIIADASWSGDRYKFDFDLCTHDKGWEQYDTDQDAWYFGSWVHAATRTIVTYAEGDITVVRCLTAESFNAEIASANEFYGAGFIAKAIDENGHCTTLIQDRDQFFIKEAVSQ